MPCLPREGRRRREALRQDQGRQGEGGHREEGWGRVVDQGLDDEGDDEAAEVAGAIVWLAGRAGLGGAGEALGGGEDDRERGQEDEAHRGEDDGAGGGRGGGGGQGPGGGR